MAEQPFGIAEADLLAGYDESKQVAAGMELRRLSLLCEAALLERGWVAVQ